MRRYVRIALGLALGVVMSATGQPSQAGESAQLANITAAQPDQQPVQTTGYTYQMSDGAAGQCTLASCQSCQQDASISMEAMPADGYFSDGAYGCTDGSCGYGGCDTCYDWWPGDDMLLCGLGGLRCGCICFGADYLYTRSNISQATAYMTQTTSGASGSDNFHQFDLQHESSYRLYGSYSLGGCNEELRFTFTRFNSSANATIPYATNVVVPYDIDPPPGGYTLGDVDVDLKAYDIELAKTIPLGGVSSCDGSCGCGCDYADPCDGSCGCGGCGTCCPTWDITVSGGLRFADADWTRGFVSYTAADEIYAQAHTVMNFEGGGPRIGLEGRRYLGSAGIFSLFARGDLSLLMGNLDIRTEVRQTATPTDTVITQHYRTRNVIPVTDIEGGITAQISCHSRLSTGYLFSAWHDLGMRDQELCSDTLLCSGYDDANILAFDGLFVRLEACF